MFNVTARHVYIVNLYCLHESHLKELLIKYNIMYQFTQRKVDEAQEEGGADCVDSVIGEAVAGHLVETVTHTAQLDGKRRLVSVGRFGSQ